MSHSPERAEKTCLNCNTLLHGRYCHVCGQENVDPRESFWSLITHFFNDFTHFDGKFFTTTGKLLSKPGFLPLEYINGRRAGYLHPIRMYLFTSFVFFIIFYSFVGSGMGIDIDADNSFFKPVDTLLSRSPGRSYTSVAEYDSVQNSLPKEKRDSWLAGKLKKSDILRNKTYGGRSDAVIRSVLSNFIHNFPYLLFVSLPISALFLELLYIRNKSRNNIYSGHAIFLVYLYIFTFLALLVYFGIDKIESSYGIGWLGYLKFAVLVYIGVYTLLAFRVYYAQGWGKTVFKFIIWNILAFFAIMALFIIFFLLTLLKV